MLKLINVDHNLLYLLQGLGANIIIIPNAILRYPIAIRMFMKDFKYSIKYCVNFFHFHPKFTFIQKNALIN